MIFAALGMKQASLIAAIENGDKTIALMRKISRSGVLTSIRLCRFANLPANSALTGVRLVGGSAASEGKLEIMYLGAWGTVCDDSFDTKAAKVICRMLNLMTDGAEVIDASQFYSTSTSSLEIWLDDLSCNGTEGSIDDCSHKDWGENNCTHSEDVAIRCGVNAPVRLVGGLTSYEGRVEVFFNGHWGTVCDDSTDVNFAMVVCRELGYPSSSPAVKTSGFYGTGAGHIWLDDVKCIDTEASLEECSHLPWGQNNCSHGEDVGVICRDHGIECYHCDGISDPSNCQEKIVCSPSESCQTSMYENNHQTLYSLSCQSKLVCDTFNSVPNIIGTKRATGLKTTCCDTALCNNVTLNVNHAHGVITGVTIAPSAP
ncbi:hypothetical protein CHS0354_022395 [Potamilus streckersoni]|uniref:SRCR domain-containing protein n=1 Tax=Potamilus streckersoni TaxID=2493646 RepID=A0AAE0SYA9_9BIVA|nr:hypothetical protein CHS0354_022395 [Potamilus streckersoni]